MNNLSIQHLAGCASDCTTCTLVLQVSSLPLKDASDTLAKQDMHMHLAVFAASEFSCSRSLLALKLCNFDSGALHNNSKEGTYTPDSEASEPIAITTVVSVTSKEISAASVLGSRPSRALLDYSGEPVDSGSALEGSDAAVDLQEPSPSPGAICIQLYFPGILSCS